MDLGLKPMYQTRKCLDFLSGERNLDVLDDFKRLLKLLEELTPSIKPHYHKLDEWSKPIADFVSGMLEKHGFVNGDVAGNKMLDNVMFWWGIYHFEPCYSPSLKTDVTRNHASAFERNEALKIEFGFVLDALVS